MLYMWYRITLTQPIIIFLSLHPNAYYPFTGSVFPYFQKCSTQNNLHFLCVLALLFSFLSLLLVPVLLSLLPPLNHGSSSFFSIFISLLPFYLPSSIFPLFPPSGIIPHYISYPILFIFFHILHHIVINTISPHTSIL